MQPQLYHENGVHMRPAHPIEMDIMQTKTEVKLRWSEEETEMFAISEAELIIYQYQQSIRCYGEKILIDH